MPGQFHSELISDSAIVMSAVELQRPNVLESLSPDEKNSATADLLDRDRVLLEHLSCVRYIARQLHQKLPQHLELEEIVSAGVVGLIDACSRFDPSRHIQFKSFAQFRIRGAIIDSLRKLDWGPRELRRKARELEKTTQSVTQRLGRVPSQTEIADEMGISPEQLQAVVADLKSLELGSLNKEHNDETSSEELDFVAAPEHYDPLFRCLSGERKQLLADAIESLPERERLVLTLYYYEELTMKEIGLTLGVVESRVSQIRSSALRRLRAAFGVSTAARREPSERNRARQAPARLTPAA